jgi:hypothetical protein
VIETKEISIIWEELSLFAFFIHELRFACSQITLNKDPTVWLDGASQTVGFLFRVINNKRE